MQTNSDDTERLADAATTRDLHFRNLMDNVLAGVMNTTLDGKITFVNRALARMVEFDSSEEMQEECVILRNGSKISETVSADCRSAILALLRQASGWKPLLHDSVIFEPSLITG